MREVAATNSDESAKEDVDTSFVSRISPLRSAGEANGAEWPIDEWCLRGFPPKVSQSRGEFADGNFT
jgi:hypothetical protein